MADWSKDSESIMTVRTEVFVKEQNVPLELERDGRDPQMIHVLAFYGKKAVGTARMSMDGHIGRVAVLEDMRGKNIGARLMESLEKHAGSIGIPFVHLNAQLQARGFYNGLGYEQEGEIFLEAGIKHIHMKKNIIKSP